MKGYADRAFKVPIAYNRDPSKAPHVPRYRDNLNIEREKFDITLGDGDWEYRKDPVQWGYADQKHFFDKSCLMKPHKDQYGAKFGPPSGDESMTDTDEPIERTPSQAARQPGSQKRQTRTETLATPTLKPTRV